MAKLATVKSTEVKPEKTKAQVKKDSTQETLKVVGSSPAAKHPLQMKATPVSQTPPASRMATTAVIAECREKLLGHKSDLMNRIKDARGKLDQFERGGDEADQTMRILAEQEMLNLTDRLRNQLLEIESALSRIENGSYGFCEETDEPIETDRLRAIPWTRLSIEGAEIRESMTKRFAKG